MCKILISREKKREKERDELWKKLSELEISNSKNIPPSAQQQQQHNNSPSSKK